MLWKDFREQESCDGCPLMESKICTSEPIEPPCCWFDDDTDLDEWTSNYFDEQLRWDEREDRRIQEENKKKERAKKAADTQRAMRWYCRKEIIALNQAKKALAAQEAIERFASSFAEAVNFANEMFRYKERTVVKPEISAEVKRLKTEVDTAHEKYVVKRNEFYAQRKEASHEIPRP